MVVKLVAAGNCIDTLLDFEDDVLCAFINVVTGMEAPETWPIDDELLFGDSAWELLPYIPWDFWVSACNVTKQKTPGDYRLWNPPMPS